jgi:hypothetical protein
MSEHNWKEVELWVSWILWGVVLTGIISLVIYNVSNLQRMAIKTERNAWLVYPAHEVKVERMAKERSKKERRVVSKSEIVRDAIDTLYDQEFMIKRDQ